MAKKTSNGGGGKKVSRDSKSGQFLPRNSGNKETAREGKPKPSNPGKKSQ